MCINKWGKKISGQMKEREGWKREGERRKENEWKARTRSKERNGREEKKWKEEGGRHIFHWSGKDLRKFMVMSSYFLVSKR